MLKFNFFFITKSVLIMKHLLIFFIIALFVSACETNQSRSGSALDDDRGGYLVSVNDKPSSDKKVALVVGNRLYQYGVLNNTVNDAEDVAAVLRKMGFEVIFRKNLNHRQMNQAIYSFKKRLSETKGIGFFYFAGHGARVVGTNYLLPIDNDKIISEDDLQYEAVDARKVLNAMQDARNNLNIIVLDACRDNPYSVAGRSLKRGLDKMNPPSGSIIAFATDAGKTAADSSQNGRNGLFTSHLIKALDRAYKTHQRVDDMFMGIRRAVMRESKGKQQPWQLYSLNRPYCFGGCQVANVVPNPQPKPPKPVIVTPQPKPSFIPPQPKPFPAGKVFQDRLKDGSLGPKMVVIPAGSFRMGDIQGAGYDDEQPVHRVSVEKFAMGIYEVTFAEYDKFAEATGRKKPDDYNRFWWWQRGNYPVINVSWNDAIAYTKWLSNQTGKKYRLPTEAEWEYAARAGTETKYWWGNDIGKNRANCLNSDCGDSFKYTSPVGSFSANKFGLYDTVGNVWEWTCSEYEGKYKGKEKVCINKNSYKYRVLRGGSWLVIPRGLRVANRRDASPFFSRSDYFGFRLVRAAWT
jgi:formylglycine-generating enzyme required for sulfatase activity